MAGQPLLYPGGGGLHKGLLRPIFKAIFRGNFKELLGLIFLIKALIWLERPLKALISLESIGVRVVQFSVFSDFRWPGNPYCTQGGGGSIKAY